jgi:hypothetical protein
MEKTNEPRGVPSKFGPGGMLALVLMAAGPGAALAEMGDGPRAYQLLPRGTQVASVYGLFLRGDVAADPALSYPGSDVNVDLAVLQYTRTFELGGQQSALLIGLPIGAVDGSLTLPRLTISGEADGAADLLVGAVIGLVGSPSLSLKDYVTYDPGFAMGWLVKAMLPTGSYDETQVLNLGSNRWSVQTGPLIGYVLGTSYLDPKLMTFELLPTVTFFGDNTEPFGRASRVTQDPLYRIEAHVTRNLSKAIWVSMDALYTYGGETFSDGLSNTDKQNSFALGATVSVALSRSSSIKVTYGEVIAGNTNNSDSRGVRVVWSMAF